MWVQVCSQWDGGQVLLLMHESDETTSLMNLIVLL
jgi:hypothetical protein